ncbi:Hypothetical predicted protein [Mytilus galloprovincialis]|uniref:Uncharacterized protein n=1 Tax=Mytilus galloprovincialis TaxID=29158 RepID=A0A8B6CI28_MYTGA|nr:Hypothetical predicted protein [Mytilus galloprovincialis]
MEKDKTRSNRKRTITTRRRKWIGHTSSKSNTNVTRQAIDWNPQGHRKRGRSHWRRDLHLIFRKFGKTWGEAKKLAVDEVVQGQLLALEAVLKGCDHRLKENLRKELADKTKQWIAVRQHHGIPRDIVDTYAERTLEVITKGKTTHAREFLDS